jgi:Uma2 family endonuclease
MRQNTAKIEPILTIADLESMPEDGNKYELIYGDILVSKAPSIKHQRLLHKLQFHLETLLIEHPIGILIPGAGVIFDNFNGVIPDLIYVSHERFKEIVSGERFIDAPELVIEILSPGSENIRRDKNVKRRLYGEKKVKEYWILDPENELVEVYKLQKLNLKLTGKYKGKEKIKSSIFQSITFAVEQIF